MNQRSYIRKRIAHGAQLRAADGTYDCALLNVSAGGAKLKLAGISDPQAPMTLHIDDYGDFPCELVWAADNTVGIEFLEETQIMGDVAMALAAFGPEETPRL